MGDVSNNATQLTVSQYFNQNLRSPLYSAVPNWLNGCGQKNFWSHAGGNKNFLTPCRGVWGHALPEKFEN